MDVSLPASATDAKPALAGDESGYRISVRALCNFTGRTGDLDRRFTASPTARQGIIGHQILARRRSPGHEIELQLEYRHGPVHVVGRADIFDPASNEIEEVKTCLGPPRRRADSNRSQHRAQLHTYGAMLCASRGLARVRLTLVHFDLLSETEYRESEDCEAEPLIEELEARCLTLAQWARQEMLHRSERDRYLSGLKWPLGAFRTGQRQLAASVYRSAMEGAMLRIQAPTGIGKTMGAIYPALRAAAAAKIDRVFYLTAKGTGRQNAVTTVRRLFDSAPPPDAGLRVIELVARERACEYPDRACNGDSCPLARGFYDRLPAAREAAVSRALLDRETMRSLALEHGICPYHLSTEILPFADLVIGDCNHWFDRNAMLYGLAREHQWRVTLLIDEAHHLVERSRSMYSDTLSQDSFLSQRSRGLPIDRVVDQLDALRHQTGLTSARPSLTLDEVPRGLLRVLNRLTRQIGIQLEEGAELSADLLQLHFRCLAFSSLAEEFAEHSICEISLENDGASRSRTREPERHVSSSTVPPVITGPGSPASAGTDDQSGIRISLHNVIPAPFVRERIEAAHAVVMFSATLHPEEFDHAMLGWTRPHRELLLASPFDPSRLRVRTVPLSTRIDRRQKSARPIAAVIAQQFRDEPGCYIAFFGSFEHLAQIGTILKDEFPAVPLRSQWRGMTETERERFIHGFDPALPSVSLAVMGGVFSEGMDLPGTRLIGAFIVTLGMPQVNPVNEAFCTRMDQIFGRGFEFTYLYPGVCKVIQAAGRVIRDVEDRGTVVLIDERWRQARYRSLLPAEWALGA
jgi:DNA excision repair protein ERCC-2